MCGACVRQQFPRVIAKAESASWMLRCLVGAMRPGAEAAPVLIRDENACGIDTRRSQPLKKNSNFTPSRWCFSPNIGPYRGLRPARGEPGPGS
jgi:hypothetical protein